MIGAIPGDSHLDAPIFWIGNSAPRLPWDGIADDSEIYTETRAQVRRTLAPFFKQMDRPRGPRVSDAEKKAFARALADWKKTAAGRRAIAGRRRTV